MGRNDRGRGCRCQWLFTTRFPETFGLDEGLVIFYEGRPVAHFHVLLECAGIVEDSLLADDAGVQHLLDEYVAMLGRVLVVHQVVAAVDVLLRPHSRVEALVADLAPVTTLPGPIVRQGLDVLVGSEL